MDTFLLNTIVWYVTLHGLFSKWLQVGATAFPRILDWYATTSWYWFYTIDPWGYYFWNCYMIANMLFFWGIIRSEWWKELFGG